RLVLAEILDLVLDAAQDLRDVGKRHLVARLDVRALDRGPACVAVRGELLPRAARLGVEVAIAGHEVGEAGALAGRPNGPLPAAAPGLLEPDRAIERVGALLAEHTGHVQVVLALEALQRGHGRAVDLLPGA